MTSARPWALVLLLTMVLFGCAAPPIKPPPAMDPEAAWEQHRRSLQEIDGWHLTGRLALQSEGQGWHVTLDWHQGRSRYDIRLIAPFGSDSLRLIGDAQSVALEQSDGELLCNADPEALLERQVGWHVPLAALRYWVLGLPAPGPIERRELDDYGRLSQLGQAGWAIRFLDYASRGTRQLPGRVFVTNQQLQVRLVVDRWQPDGAPIKLPADCHRAGGLRG